MADHIVYRAVSLRYNTGYEAVTAGSTVDPAAAPVSIAAGTTLGAQRVVVGVSAGAIDSTAFVGSSSWSNGSLTSPGFFVWCQTDTGHGGGLHSGHGQKATAGSGGTFSSNWDGGSTKQANMSLALIGDGTNYVETYDFTTGSGVDDVVASLPIFGGGFGILLLIQTANEQVELSANSANWTLLGSIGVGTEGAVGSTRLTMYWIDADTSPSVGPTISIVASGTNYTIVAESGTMAIDGTAADVDMTRRTVADSATVSFDGTQANVILDRKTVAETASVVFDGTQANLGVGYRTVAESATVDFSGTEAAITMIRRLVADAAVVGLEGTEALIRLAQTFLVAESSTVGFSGTDAALRLVSKIVAEAATLALEGTQAFLRFSADSVNFPQIPGRVRHVTEEIRAKLVRPLQVLAVDLETRLATFQATASKVHPPRGRR